MESATQERHATGKQLISTDFRVMGRFFFSLSTWPRRVMEECRQSSSSSLYIMLRDSQRLKHMHTHRERERVVITHFSNCVPHSLTHSLPHSITPPTHIPSHLVQYSANSHVSKVKKKTKKNLIIKPAEVHDLHACLRGRVGGGLSSPPPTSRVQSK